MVRSLASSRRRSTHWVLGPDTDNCWIANPAFLCDASRNVTAVYMDQHDYAKYGRAACAPDASLFDKFIYRWLATYKAFGFLRLYEYARETRLYERQQEYLTSRAHATVNGLQLCMPQFAGRFAAANSAEWTTLGIESKGRFFLGNPEYAQIIAINRNETKLAERGNFAYPPELLLKRCAAKLCAGMQVRRNLADQHGYNADVVLLDLPVFGELVSALGSDAVGKLSGSAAMSIKAEEFSAFNVLELTKLQFAEGQLRLSAGAGIPDEVADVANGFQSACDGVGEFSGNYEEFEEEVLDALDWLERSIPSKVNSKLIEIVVDLINPEVTLAALGICTSLSDVTPIMKWFFGTGALAAAITIPGVYLLSKWPHLIKDASNDALSKGTRCKLVRDTAETLYGLQHRSRRRSAICEFFALRERPRRDKGFLNRPRRLVHLTHDRWLREAMRYEDNALYETALHASGLSS